MDEASKGQVSGSAAEIYEAFFVPALFREPADAIAEAIAAKPNARVLDVACGTGILARSIAARSGSGMRVTGLDRNAGMLAQARSKAGGIDWQEGTAEDLPFADASFDVVVSQFGLMFFDDRVAALREMWRVLRAGGTLGAAVWDALERSPGYASMAGLLQRLFGTQVADALRAPFTLGDAAAVRSLLESARIVGADVRVLPVTARFPSLEAWVHTDVKGWTLADTIDERQYQQLLAEARRELVPYVQSDGSVAFASPALLAIARKT